MRSSDGSGSESEVATLQSKSASADATNPGGRAVASVEVEGVPRLAVRIELREFGKVGKVGKPRWSRSDGEGRWRVRCRGSRARRAEDRAGPGKAVSRRGF
eukprot:1233594-Amorphochlora_amoeboformis.AAC.1